MGVKSTEIIRRIVTLAANEDANDIPVFIAEKALRVTAITLTAEASVAAADTNYSTFVFKTGSSTIATYANGPVSGGTSLVVKTPKALTVTATEVAKDAVVFIDCSHASSGLAAGRVLVEITVSALSAAVN